jgi:hypothetical protein
MTTTATFALLCSACGITVLAPPAAPRRVIPQLAEAPLPPPDGTTPVSIDSADAPARVYETYHDICVTPCVVNLEPGVHDLRFQPVNEMSMRGGTTAVTVGRRPIAFRYEMERTAMHPALLGGGLTLLTLGLTAGTSAIPLTIIPSTRTAGAVTAIAAGVAIALSIVMILESNETYQPGAATQWSPDDGRIFTLDR